MEQEKRQESPLSVSIDNYSTEGKLESTGIPALNTGGSLAEEKLEDRSEMK